MPEETEISESVCTHFKGRGELQDVAMNIQKIVDI